LDFYFKSSK